MRWEVWNSKFKLHWRALRAPSTTQKRAAPGPCRRPDVPGLQLQQRPVRHEGAEARAVEGEVQEDRVRPALELVPRVPLLQHARELEQDLVGSAVAVQPARKALVRLTLADLRRAPRGPRAA